MITLTPNSAPIDVSYARDILALIGDPAASKARLDELVAMAEHASVQVDAATKLQRDVDAKVAANDAAAKALADKTAAFTVYNKTRTDQLNSMDDTLTARQKALDGREAASVASSSARDLALQKREDAVKAREAAVADLEASNNTIKADLDRRMAIIKSLGA